MQGLNIYFTPRLEFKLSKCIQEGVFPDSYKIAQVIPLFKRGDKEDSQLL